MLVPIRNTYPLGMVITVYDVAGRSTTTVLPSGLQPPRGLGATWSTSDGVLSAPRSSDANVEAMAVPGCQFNSIQLTL